VQANSRDDVTLNPESLAFGQIRRGSQPVAKVSVAFVGNSDWQITDARCDTNYVQVKAEPVRRDTGEVTYEIAARVRGDAPVGKWYTDVWLTTNNPATPRLRVPLTVEIQSALSVSPSVAVLGKVKLGEETERKVIVRGVKPFRITGVQGTDNEISVRDSASASKPVHILTVKLKAAKAGDLARTFRVQTDLKEDSEIEFRATAEVGP
jgi:hypothetical protein